MMALSILEKPGPAPYPQHWPASVISAGLAYPTPHPTPTPGSHEGQEVREKKLTPWEPVSSKQFLRPFSK